ncbi:MAG: hypothetical protein RSE05_02900 [Clostridium sp.]
MKTKKTVKKLTILLVIFVLALAGYFLLSQKKGKNDIAYTAIEDANLPIAYLRIFDKKMNCLYGFLEDKPTSAGRTVLTIIPSDRCLPVDFEGVSSKVKGIQYEIRSMDGERLVERTVLEEWTQEGDQVSAVLPIQNLLTKEEEYRMTLAIVTEEYSTIYYYTRIVWSDNAYIQDMVSLAEDFSSKTMNYDEARELTTYLETDAAIDNSSLGRVSLKHSFSQLTWRGMKMEREGEIFVNLKEMQGIMGVIQLNYVAAHIKEDGGKDYFDVTETFTMKWNAQRIYMMDYDRRVNQVFSGDSSQYTNKRIMLGISDEDNLKQVSDPSGKYKAFVINKALWCYDTEKESSTKVFAFRKNETDLKANFDQHGVKILSVDGTGAVDFLVYGYMNRGNHEGSTGVAVYRYESAGNTLTERLYLPADEEYGDLKQDIDTLSSLSDNQILYILMNHAVYGVDLTSKEYMVVADELTEENFAVSSDGSRIAWQEGKDLYESSQLHVMELQTGDKRDIHFSDGTMIRLVGFVGNDLVYGLAKPGEKLSADGRVVGLPMYVLEIVGADMAVQTRYEKPGVFISDVEIQGSRIHLVKMVNTGTGYTKTEEDTLVCNEQVVQEPLEGMGYIADAEAGRLYFVQLDTEDQKKQNIKSHVPKKVVAEEDNVIELQANKKIKKNNYFAYSEGRMSGSYTSFKRTLQAAYDGMGLVTDESGQVIWVRANRENAKTVKEVQNYVPKINHYLEEFIAGSNISSDGTEIIDARGCTLNQVLYFVFAGHPIAAYLGDGNYAIIYGYDQYNISCLWNPGTAEAYTDKMGLNDASAYFENHGENDFICFLPAK